MDQTEQFIESLDGSITLALQLETILLDETCAIEARDPSELQTIVAQKQSASAQLERDTQRQARQITAAGYPFTPEGVADFINALDEADYVADLWRELQDIVWRCRQLNDANAQSIERRRDQVTRSLALLLGQETITTYHADGRRDLELNTNHITRSV